MKPLITCVCVTENRVHHLKKAISYFLNQSYDSKELLVLHKDYDETTMNFLEQHQNPQIRSLVIPSQENLTLGEVRNISIEESNGEYFCQWDDDDWYHRERLEIQLQAALKSHKDGSLLMHLIFYNAENHKAYFSFMRPWENSIFCKKDVLKYGIAYQKLNKKEDTLFVNELISQNRLCPVNSYPIYIYTYHGGNTWNKSHFEYLFSISQELSSEISYLIKEIIHNKVDYKTASEILKSEKVMKELNYFYRPD